MVHLNNSHKIFFKWNQIEDSCLRTDKDYNSVKLPLDSYLLIMTTVLIRCELFFFIKTFLNVMSSIISTSRLTFWDWYGWNNKYLLSYNFYLAEECYFWITYFIRKITYLRDVVTYLKREKNISRIKKNCSMKPILPYPKIIIIYFLFWVLFHWNLSLITLKRKIDNKIFKQIIITYKI